MYFGFLLVLLGWAIFLSNALAVALIPAFVVYMNRFQIGPEERAHGSIVRRSVSGIHRERAAMDIDIEGLWNI